MANNNLVVTSLDTIKQSIINRFTNDPRSPFKDYPFEGSGLNYLIDILTYVTFYNNYYSAINVNEMFLPYAQMDKNIYSLARSLGYLPKRVSSATAQITATLPINIPNVDKTKDIVIPAYSTLKSGKGLNWILTEELRFRYNATESSPNKWILVQDNVFNPKNTTEEYFYFIKQGQYESTIYVPNQQANQKLFLDKTNIDNGLNSILIQDSKTYEYWKPFYDMSDYDFDLPQTTAMLIPPNKTVEELKNEIIIDNIWENYVLNLDAAKIFFFNEDEGGTYIFFGDETLGATPTNTMDIYYLLSEGVSGNGESTFGFDGILSYYKVDGSIGRLNMSSITVSTRIINSVNSISSGGAVAETSSSIKKLAPSFWNAQNREVITEDYETFLMQQNSVQLENCKCISGDKMKPIVMGAVGIVCNKRTETTDDIVNSLLDDKEKALLKFIVKNKNVVTIEPNFLNPEFVKINLSLDVYYNPMIYTEQNTQRVLANTISLFFYGLNGFNKYFKSSNLTTIFDESAEIDHCLLSADLEYYKLIQTKEIPYLTYINLGSQNIIAQNSISKITINEAFLKIYNDNTFYLKTELTMPNGVPTATWNTFLTAIEKTGDTDYTNIHKIFFYQLSEINIRTENEVRMSDLILTEYYVKQLLGTTIEGSTSAPYFFEYESELTGRTKKIGTVYYDRRIIRTYFDDMNFKRLDDNKKNRYLALKTTAGVPDESTINSYQSFADLFLYEYTFDSDFNVPLIWDGATGTAEIRSDTMLTEFPFTFAFDTEKEDYKSDGNIIIRKGNTTDNVRLIPEYGRK